MKRIACVCVLCGTITAGFVGCRNQEASIHNRVEVTHDDGFGSLDVVTVANQASAELLNSKIVLSSGKPLTIAVSPMRKVSAFKFDANLFLRRLRLELNRQGKDKLRFIAQGQTQNVIREHIRNDANSDRIQNLLASVAKEITSLPELEKGATLALLPSTQVNFVNLNAESYLATLRSKIVSESGRKCRFLMPGILQGAEYYLSGMFIADSDKTEGMINLVDYIRDLERAEREGKSLFEVVQHHSHIEKETVSLISARQTTTDERFSLRPRLPYQASQDKSLRERPKVAKFLNVMLVNTKNKCSVYEKQVKIESVSTGFGESDYILSAEISDINKGKDDTRYALVTLQLIDPIRNVIVWETGYETKFLKD